MGRRPLDITGLPWCQAMLSAPILPAFFWWLFLYMRHRSDPCITPTASLSRHPWACHTVYTVYRQFSFFISPTMSTDKPFQFAPTFSCWIVLREHKIMFGFSSISRNWHGTGSLISSDDLVMQRAALRARFMGPTWGPSGADRTQVGPMLAPWTLLSGRGIVVVLTSLSRPRHKNVNWPKCAKLFSCEKMIVEVHGYGSKQSIYQYPLVLWNYS